MTNEYDFFIISKEDLKGNKIFPFQLFVFNPTNKKFSMVLNGNRPLTNELSNFVDYLLDKGGKLAVLKKQKKTFLISQQINESEIPSLKNRELHALEKERIMYIKLKEMYEEKRGSFAFQTEFELAITNDNFEKIIESARVEILTFSVTHSYTVSFAIHLAKEFLIKDNYLNRIVATAYHLTKTMNINEQEALSDVIVASYLMHIGLTQLPLSSVRKAYLSLFDEERKLFQKHTILGNHLIKRSNAPLSERCKKMILDHHERTHGNGYPSEKYGEAIETLALLIGAVSHLFEFSSGRINGSKQSMKSVIFAIKNKTFTPGLELDFGDKINTSIINLINTEKIESKAA